MERSKETLDISKSKEWGAIHSVFFISGKALSDPFLYVSENYRVARLFGCTLIILITLTTKSDKSDYADQ